MPVSGRELASLDFANLIGGPLNAVIEAQAKSAITTANFIKEVAFDKDGNVVNVDFTYNRKNEDGDDQEFKLKVPFLTMLPVPYITIVDTVIEFNAKITSTNESTSESNFSQQVDASAGGRYWFVSAKVSSKTSYQKKSATSEKEERTFDMHVRVQAKNQDMPAGTERLLTILENSIEEEGGKNLKAVTFKLISKDTTNGKIVTVQIANVNALDQIKDKEFEANDASTPTPLVKKFKITNVDKTNKIITLDNEVNDNEMNNQFKIEIK